MVLDSKQSVAVGIFLLELDDALMAQASSLWEMLDAEEIEKANRRLKEKDRVQYAAAHALLRYALFAWTSVPGGEWRFARSETGRPRVTNAGFESLSFSLSHTDGLVGCALAENCGLGFDLEWLERPTLSDGVKALVFSDDELAELHPLQPREAALYALQLWTLKEAFFKAMGTGLKGDLRAASFHLGGIPHPSSIAHAWRFQTLRPTAHHCGALCCSLDPSVQTHVVTRDELRASFSRSPCAPVDRSFQARSST